MDEGRVCAAASLLPMPPFQSKPVLPAQSGTSGSASHNGPTLWLFRRSANGHDRTYTTYVAMTKMSNISTGLNHSIRS
jgi:hypothetical protein